MADTPAMVLTKRGMLAVSRAIEDETAARANGALLIGAFQEAQFWRASARRWSALARVADTAIALGAPKRSYRAGLWHVPVAATAPVAREWAVICDAHDYVACVVGVELPPRGGDDDERRFEALWTVEPRAVREAARTALLIAAETVPEIETVTTNRLTQPVPASQVATRNAIALANRIVMNYDRLLRG
jgi:DICT domain-containing protein